MELQKFGVFVFFFQKRKVQPGSNVIQKLKFVYFSNKYNQLHINSDRWTPASNFSKNRAKWVTLLHILQCENWSVMQKLAFVFNYSHTGKPLLQYNFECYQFGFQRSANQVRSQTVSLVADRFHCTEPTNQNYYKKANNVSKNSQNWW